MYIYSNSLFIIPINIRAKYKMQEMTSFFFFFTFIGFFSRQIHNSLVPLIKIKSYFITMKQKLKNIKNECMLFGAFERFGILYSFFLFLNSSNDIAKKKKLYFNY